MNEKDLPELDLDIAHLEARIASFEDEFFTSSSSRLRVKWYKIGDSLYNQYRPASFRKLAYLLSEIFGVPNGGYCALLEFFEVGPNQVKPKVTNGVGILLHRTATIGPLDHEYRFVPVPLLLEFLEWFFEKITRVASEVIPPKLTTQTALHTTLPDTSASEVNEAGYVKSGSEYYDIPMSGGTIWLPGGGSAIWRGDSAPPIILNQDGVSVANIPNNALPEDEAKPPSKPPKPGENASYDDWFDWYHILTDQLGYRMTLKELATEMGLTYGTTRRYHSEYMAQNDRKG